MMICETRTKVRLVCKDQLVEFGIQLAVGRLRHIDEVGQIIGWRGIQAALPPVYDRHLSQCGHLIIENDVIVIIMIRSRNRSKLGKVETRA